MVSRAVEWLLHTNPLAESATYGMSKYYKRKGREHHSLDLQTIVDDTSFPQP